MEGFTFLGMLLVAALFGIGLVVVLATLTAAVNPDPPRSQSSDRIREIGQAHRQAMDELTAQYERTRGRP